MKNIRLFLLLGFIIASIIVTSVLYLVKSQTRSIALSNFIYTATDQVSAHQTIPDGTPDYALDITLTKGDMIVDSVMVNLLDDQGNVLGQWDTRNDNPGLWTVGLFRQGQTLNQGKAKYLEILWQQNETLHLQMSSNSAAKPGGKIVVTVNYNIHYSLSKELLLPSIP